MSFAARTRFNIPYHPGIGQAGVLGISPGLPKTADAGYWAVRLNNSSWPGRIVVSKYPLPAAKVGATVYAPTLGECDGHAVFATADHDSYIWYARELGLYGQYVLTDELGVIGDGWWNVDFPSSIDGQGSVYGGGTTHGSRTVEWYWPRYTRSTLTSQIFGRLTGTGGATGSRTLGNPYWMDGQNQWTAGTVYPEDGDVRNIGPLIRIDLDGVKWWVENGRKLGKVYATMSITAGTDITLEPLQWSGHALVHDPEDPRPYRTITWGGWADGDGKPEGQSYMCDGAIWRS